LGETPAARPPAVSRLAAPFVRLGAKDDLSAHLKKIGGAFVSFGKNALAATGLGGVLGGLLGGLGVKDTLDDLRKLDDTAKALGVSGRQASGLFGVLEAVGGDFGENVEGITQFSNAIQTALSDTSKTTALFDGLSVSAKDLAGVPLDEQFYRIHDAIRGLPQDQQAYRLGLVGGTDSMKKWLPLLSMSNEELRAQAAGLALGNQELADAAAASKAMKEAQAGVNRAWQQGVVVLAPLVTELARMVGGPLTQLREYLQGRTLGDIGEEAFLRLKAAGIDWAIGVQDLFADVWDFFASGWDSAVLVVKNLFADLAEFAARSMIDALKGPLDLLEKVNPGLAGTLRGGLSAGLTAGATGVRRQAQAEFDANEAARKKAREVRQDGNADARAAVARQLAAVEARVEGQRTAALFKEFMDDLQKAPAVAGKAVAAAAGRAAGTFGGSADFIGRSMGGGNPVERKLDAANKLAEKQLTELRQIVRKVGFPTIT
jgi:hypothetical protein